MCCFKPNVNDEWLLEKNIKPFCINWACFGSEFRSEQCGRKKTTAPWLIVLPRCGQHGALMLKFWASWKLPQSGEIWLTLTFLESQKGEMHNSYSEHIVQVIFWKLFRILDFLNTILQPPNLKSPGPPVTKFGAWRAGRESSATAVCFATRPQQHWGNWRPDLATTRESYGDVRERAENKVLKMWF